MSSLAEDHDVPVPLALMQQIASETIQQQEHEANAGDHLVGGNDNDELRVSIQGDDSLIDPQVTASEQHDHQKQQQHQQHQQQQQQGQDQNGILVGNAASGSGHLDGAAPTTATVTKVPGRPGPKPGKKRKAANANISTEFDPDYQQDLTTTGDQQQGARQQSEEADKAVKQTKRAAQNRAAQKAFRERRELYIKELERKAVEFDDLRVREQNHTTRIMELEAALNQAHDARANMAVEISDLHKKELNWQAERKKLLDEIAALKKDRLSQA